MTKLIDVQKNTTNIGRNRIFIIKTLKRIEISYTCVGITVLIKRIGKLNLNIFSLTRTSLIRSLILFMRLF